MGLLFVLIFIAGVLAVAIALQPSDFLIKRTAVMYAPASNIFAQVNNLRSWAAWSPWIKLDPAAKNTFEGPLAGTGAITKWSGNKRVGTGTMTITQSQPSDFIKFRLDFVEPFEATHNAEFTFKPDGNKTIVTWRMYGENNFLRKAMSLLLNCDKMVGTQFEKGLMQLKSVSESPNKQ